MSFARSDADICKPHAKIHSARERRRSMSNPFEDERPLSRAESLPSAGSASPAEEKEIADFLRHAVANKKSAPNSAALNFFSKLPQVARTQPFSNMGQLLDAGAKIFAYRVDQTYVGAMNALRDINTITKQYKKNGRSQEEEGKDSDEGKKPKKKRKEVTELMFSSIKTQSMKFLLPESDFGADNDSQEPYNPLYSKTIRRTGVTSGALMLTNTTTSDDGLIMRLHPRPFSVHAEPEPDYPTADEVAAHEDLLGVMQLCLQQDRKTIGKLFPSVSKKGLNDAVKRRRTIKLDARVIRSQLEGLEDSVEFDATTSAENAEDFRDDLLDPYIFIEEGEEEKKTMAKTKGRPKKKKVTEVLEPRLMYHLALAKSHKQNHYTVRCDYETLKRLPCSTDYLAEINRDFSLNILSALTEEDAEQVGASPGFLQRLKNAANEKVIGEELQVETSSMVSEAQKKMFLEILFGSAQQKGDENGRVNEESLAHRYMFTEDFHEFDSMWHCEVAKTDAVIEESQRSRNRSASVTRARSASVVSTRTRRETDDSYLLKPGYIRYPLFLKQNMHRNRQGYRWKDQPRFPRCVLHVHHVPRIDTIVTNQEHFTTRVCVEGAMKAHTIFFVLDKALKAGQSSSRPSDFWVKPNDEGLFFIRNEEPVSLTQAEMETSVLIDEDRTEEDDNSNVYGTPIKRPRYTTPAIPDEVPSERGFPSNFGQSEGLFMIKEEPCEEPEPVPATPFEDHPCDADGTFLGALGAGSIDDCPGTVLRNLADDCHWKTVAEPETEMRKRRQRTPSYSNVCVTGTGTRKRTTRPKLTPRMRNLLKSRVRPLSERMAEQNLPEADETKQMETSRDGTLGTQDSVLSALLEQNNRCLDPTQPSYFGSALESIIEEGFEKTEEDAEAKDTLEDNVGHVGLASEDQSNLPEEDAGDADDFVDPYEPLEPLDDLHSTRVDDPVGEHRVASQASSGASVDPEDEEEAFCARYKYKQTRVDAPLVKQAFASILSDPTKGIGQVILSTSHLNVTLEDGVEEELNGIKSLEDLKALGIRVTDFTVSGHHTFTRLLEQIPALVDEQTAEDMKISTALTILLHMCNENILQLEQERCASTGLVPLEALGDFVISSQQR
ncbi:hypothetical protein L596_018254 [Steinernema carpocapsae]|uniref:Condensin complex subunit 2 n=1 Tax=Steinernema carpocapsae TaxID=34508 RepID=A0A4U5N4J5_STECR|nr:hypothetical protein L596_018254 [Steinernema carpocapsae]